MEHLTYEDIEEKFPEEYAAREVNKLTYRYPSGESYQVSDYQFLAAVHFLPQIRHCTLLYLQYFYRA